MVLSLLLEEMKPGNWGEAQNYNVGVTASLQATMTSQDNITKSLGLTPLLMGKAPLKT